MIKITVVAKPVETITCTGCLRELYPHCSLKDVDFLVNLGLPSCNDGYVYILEKKDD